MIEEKNFIGIKILKAININLITLLFAKILLDLIKDISSFSTTS